jgi:hypothetical protein
MCSFNYAGGSFPTLPTPRSRRRIVSDPSDDPGASGKTKWAYKMCEKMCAYLVGSGLDFCPVFPD